MSFDLGSNFLSFKLSGLEGLAREILSPQVLEKALLAALDEVEAQLKANFTKREAEWKPLALSTQYQRRRQGYGPTGPILRRSGTLMKNAASGREVEVSGDEIRGDVFPNDDAEPPYGSASIGDYMEALNKVRPFYYLDGEQMDAVYAAFEESLIAQLEVG